MSVADHTQPRNQPIVPDFGLVHPLWGTSLTNWFALLRENRGLAARCLPRAAAITLFSLLNLTGRLRASMLYGRRVRATAIEQDPVFVLGHWRSGTTFLHEMLSRDPRLAPLTLWHTMSPRSFLALGYLRPLYAMFLPRTRPMDAITVALDASYEEEAGLAALGRFSFFHALYFPQQADRHFRRDVLFEGMSEADRRRFADDYLYLLKAVTYASGGQRLVLKNPANTARIPQLLEMFPNAKFIHISRDPYRVFLSTKKMRTETIRYFGMQSTTEQEVERQTLADYKGLMGAYFEQRSLIPEGQLVELRFEDFEADPLGQARRIYETLDLPGFDDADEPMQQFLAGQADYRKNEYRFEDDVIDRVNREWAFAFEKLGYPMQQPASSAAAPITAAPLQASR